MHFFLVGEKKGMNRVIIGGKIDLEYGVYEC